ncbi:ABC transporter permease [Amycolatopsis sp. NBC_01307]|uniref:ABC transporter permease n=1 Tax=Amycolatopsis sp. NBC_01307 TaxID=2903561 RepID=UPI002E14A59E|nr:ABC transporter permease [Amycolatopsis sp. NBC_01307]
MTGYAARRLLAAVPTLLLAVALVFVLLHLIPGDATAQLLGGKASAADVARRRAELGLDRPVPSQLGTFLAGLSRGDLGTSLTREQPVSQVIGAAAAPTLLLLVLGTAVSALAALAAGTLAAYHRGRALDHLVRAASVTGGAVPSFCLAIVLIQLLALNLRLLPVSGYRAGLAGLPYLVLPVLTFAVMAGSVLTRLVRAGVLAELPREYVGAAVARGIPARRVRTGYVQRNAVLPVVTYLGTNLGSLIGVVVVIENVCAVPGLGQLLVRSVLERDLPVVQGIALVLAVLVIGGNILADLVCAALDPRFRL